MQLLAIIIFSWGEVKIFMFVEQKPTCATGSCQKGRPCFPEGPARALQRLSSPRFLSECDFGQMHYELALLLICTTADAVGLTKQPDVISGGQSPSGRAQGADVKPELSSKQHLSHKEACSKKSQGNVV